MAASGLWPFVYTIIFQVRQIPATTQATLFLLSLVLFCGSRVLKKISVLLVSNLFTFLKVGEIIVQKYGYFILPGVFPDKIVLDIDFTDERVVPCDVQVLKILL